MPKAVFRNRVRYSRKRRKLAPSRATSSYSLSCDGGSVSLSSAAASLRRTDPLSVFAAGDVPPGLYPEDMFGQAGNLADGSTPWLAE